MESQAATGLQALLDDARRRLVETGTRNRLIHVNRANPRTNALNIVGERADDVFATLRRRGKRMRLRALGKDRAEDATGEADGPDLAEDYLAAGDDARRDDAFLDTPLGPDGLQKRLLRLAGEARTAEEEQGVNILYLALGFLSWFEDPASRIRREAPLVLLPVDLVRNERGSGFELRRRDDDLVANLPLQERLRRDFGIVLPEIEESEDWAPGAYFEAVAGMVSGLPRWAVAPDAMQLGFFSFAKLLMLRDLDPANWPEGRLGSLDLMRRLLRDGFEEDAPLFGARDRLDDRLDPAALLHIVDADASQAKVIEEVRAGRNLVVQGPPGTGKSQTIANIVAAAVHDGKTVLFMAEKMAALEVVHGRLVRCGLADICLELHSRSASRKAVLTEIARTLEAGARPLPAPADPAALREARAQLNAIAALLHDRVPGRDYTPFATIAEIAGLIGRGVPPPTIAQDGLAALSNAERAALAQAVGAHAARAADAGPARRHPFAGSTAEDLQPTDLARLGEELTAARGAIAGLVAALGALGGFLPVPASPTLRDGETLCALLDLLGAIPAASRPLAIHLFAHATDGPVDAALAAGLAWQQAREAAEPVFAATAWTGDATALRAPIAGGVASLIARFMPAYRRASAHLAGLLRSELPKTAALRLDLVDRLLDIARLRANLAAEAPLLAAALGPHWRGESTDFAAARAVLAQVAAIRATARLAAAPDLAAALEGLPAAAARHADLAASVAAARRTVAAVFGRLTADATVDRDGFALGEMAARCAALADGIGRYGQWVALRRGMAQLEAWGLGTLVAAIEEERLAPAAAVDEFLYASAEARWAHARAALPALSELRGTDRHEAVRSFQDLERARMTEVRGAVLARHRSHLPRGAAGEMGHILGEIAKRRGHKPIRSLVAAAGTALTRIKPVFLMSPVSIAQFLPPGRLSFDLLIVDEASQVRPEDALGAVARASQIVVVGDQKQLPPTSFFDRLTSDAPEDGQAEDPDADAPPSPVRATELESILTLCAARGLGGRMLEWHYRSRDPSLIRVSNAEFYADRLILPPSPLQLDSDYGLSFVRVPGVYSSKTRGGGRAGTNRIEAEAIARHVASHARTHPELSLGIVAFSKAQADMLTETLEAARRDDPLLDAFLREGRSEDVFVKNIENVQGDERDTILISVGYGPHEPGGRLAAMNFGPVNAEGGERRLNVVFTRARARCVVFASFDPGDIALDRTSRDGPRILKRFLEFARSGRLDQSLPSGAGADSPFEADVAREIAALGYRADPQVGSAGFRIDIGVRHPERPGRYIMAVECDGATWHGALWARERDRLRQDVLEGLGWQFHRIWSTDWFHSRSREIDRLRAALAVAAMRADQASPLRGANAGATADPAEEEQPDEDQGAALPAADAAPPAEVPHLADRLRIPPYARAAIEAPASGEPHEIPAATLAEMVVRVVEAEGPVHLEEVARRIAAGFGKSRSGGRIQQATAEALALARRAGRLDSMREFWMTPGQKVSPPVRARHAETLPTTRAAYLSPLEIRAAAAVLARECGAVPADEMPRAIARLLGYRRLGRDLEAHIRAALEG
jgi:hypothetical protein